MGVLWTCAALLVQASAGPLHRYPRESEDYQNIDLSAYANFTANEVCFSDNEVFQKGDVMPNPGPCEECRCEPPSIVCNMIKCPVNNNGCRTIQRANHCCPDYNCECDYNGQLYNDGERVDTPEESCQVCYCKGGDVMCTSITCYQRDDCQPIQVPGQCCPKYKNCPIRDESSNADGKNVRSRSPNKSSNHSPKREMQPWLLTKSVHQTSSIPVFKQTTSSEDTTEDGNTIIVSDWLTERRTTTEDGTHQDSARTDLVGFGHTNGLHGGRDTSQMTTIHQLASNTYNTDGSMLIRKSETITPVDEVIFTRVDILRNNQEQNVDTSTVDPSLEDASTNSPSNMYNNEDTLLTTINNYQDKVATIHDYTTPDQEMNMQVKNLSEDTTQVQPISFLVFGNEEEMSHSTVDGLANLSETFVTASDLIGLDEKMQTNKNVETENSPFTHITLNEVNGSTDTPILPPSTEEVSNENIHPLYTEENRTPVESGLDILSKPNGDDQLAEGSIEHEFEFDGSNEDTLEGASTNNPQNVQGTPIKLLVSQENYAEAVVQSTTTRETPTEAVEFYTIGDNISLDSRKNDSSGLKLIEELKFDQDSFTTNLHNNEKTIKDEDTIATTENSEQIMEFTTPYLTEDHMDGLNLESGNLLQENSGEEETDFTEGSTTEFVKTTTISNDKLEVSRHENHLAKSADLEEENGGTDSGLKVETTTYSFITSTDATKINLTNMSDLHEIKNYNVLSNEETTTDVIKGLDVDLSIKINPSNSVNDAISATKEKTNVTENTDQLTYSTENTLTTTKETPENLLRDNLPSVSKEAISNIPPVLELNSHVPFLQFGGQVSSDVYSELVEENLQSTLSSFQEEFASEPKKDHFKEEYTSNPPVVSMSTVVKTSILSDDTALPVSSTIVGDESKTNSEAHTNNTNAQLNIPLNETVSTTTTSHIPLTPGDLKVLAEYLINERIRPVNTSRESEYTANQWLKGNLTSEENMASILSAANISIGIINQTESGAKSISHETSTKLNEVIRADKFEKDNLFKGNNILNNDNAVINKTGYLHSKYNKNHDSFKDHQKSLNDAKELNENTSTATTFLEISTSKTNTGTDIYNQGSIPVIQIQDHSYNFLPNFTHQNVVNNNSNPRSNEKFEEHSVTQKVSNNTNTLTTTQRSFSSQTPQNRAKEVNQYPSIDEHPNETKFDPTNKKLYQDISSKSLRDSNLEEEHSTLAALEGNNITTTTDSLHEHIVIT